MQTPSNNPFFRNNPPPRVSVITTIYNGESFLLDNIQSIKQQSYQDFEHIIVDDGSTDNTKTLLASQSNPQLRIDYLPKCGRGKSLNHAIKLATGEYIAILDVDDKSFVNRLKLQIEHMEKNLECHVLAGHFTVEDGSKGGNEDGTVEPIQPSEFIKRNMICHSSVMIRKDILIKIGGYNEERSMLFDYDLWYRMAIHGVNFFKMNQTIVFKRIHQKQNFERKRRLLYLWSATVIKYKFYARFGRGFFNLMYPIATFFYGILPASFRKVFMELWR